MPASPRLLLLPTPLSYPCLPSTVARARVISPPQSAKRAGAVLFCRMPHKPILRLCIAHSLRGRALKAPPLWLFACRPCQAWLCSGLQMALKHYNTGSGRHRGWVVLAQVCVPQAPPSATRPLRRPILRVSRARRRQNPPPVPAARRAPLLGAISHRRLCCCTRSPRFFWPGRQLPSP